MHSRHRGPGNGYRSSPRGMGGGSMRMPPENSVRGGHGMFNQDYHNNDYRNNYSYGYGRGHPRPPPTHASPPTPQYRPDIFAEAGRLATEYLVSKGVLPSNVFTGKWQNGSLKNMMRDFRGFRQQEGDSLPHNHSRNGADSGHGRRRQSDEYSKPDGSKSNSRDKRRLNSNESDLGSLTEKGRSSLDIDEKRVDSEAAGKAGQASSESRDVKPTSDFTGESKAVVDNICNSDDVAGDGKNIKVETGVELPKMVDDVKSLDREPVDPRDGSDSCQFEKKTGNEDVVVHDCTSEIQSDENLSRTKDCTMKGPEGDFVLIAEEEKELDASQGNNCDDGPSAESEVVFKEVSVDDSTVMETPIIVEGSKHADPDSVKQNSIRGELNQMDTDQGSYTRSQSLPLSSFMFEHECTKSYLGIGRCSSMTLKRGEKRTADYNNDMSVIKKPRDWDRSGVTQMDEYSHPSELTLIQDLPSVEKVGSVAGGESLLQKKDVEIMEYTEEMQLFPGSFKICDLNTVEASQRNEISVPNPKMLPPFTENEKEINLSTSSNHDMSGKYNRRGTDGKEIEVIDLDDDCLQHDSIFKSSERKEDAVFMGSESFPDHAQIVNGISSVQDNYELMMSDFLGNDIVGPGNVNSLPNDMALDNGEGILGDDESIYMSLGEIPISYLGVWEQSNQGFDNNKPF